jgi:hypothetical protein
MKIVPEWVPRCDAESIVLAKSLADDLGFSYA